jgi:DNA topoisomerase IB
VNEYLREITHQDFTAKDFRTWAGTVLACEMLQEFEAFASQTQAKRNVVQAIEDVAARLGNTPSGDRQIDCVKCSRGQRRVKLLIAEHGFYVVLIA